MIDLCLDPQVLHEPAFLLETTLESGQAILFNNRRVSDPCAESCNRREGGGLRGGVAKWLCCEYHRRTHLYAG